MRTLDLSRRRLSFAALGILAVVAIGAAPSQAANPFVAGERSTRPVAAPPDATARAAARGQALAIALGLAGSSQRVERLDDRFDHRTYDEVTRLDNAGRQVAIARLDLDGTVAMAVALGWHGSGSQAIGGAEVAGRATGLARAAGLAVTGLPTVHASAGAGGWSVAWPRSVDGVPVRGDGVRVNLWPDGTFHGLTRTERPLASAPSSPIARAAASAAAAAVIAGRFGASAANPVANGASLAWLAPNDTFRPIRLDAPAETLRLAWVFRYDATAALAEGLRSVEIWIDAGDGSLLGGDLIE